MEKPDRAHARPAVSPPLDLVEFLNHIDGDIEREEARACIDGDPRRKRRIDRKVIAFAHLKERLAKEGRSARRLPSPPIRAEIVLADLPDKRIVAIVRPRNGHLFWIDLPASADVAAILGFLSPEHVPAERELLH